MEKEQPPFPSPSAPHQGTLLLEENKSFFSLSASSPEAFRASFRFSYSLHKGQRESGQNKTPTGQTQHQPNKKPSPTPPLFSFLL